MTKILLVLGIIVLVLGIAFGVSFLGYWIVLKAGAPKYVAVIVGVAIFCVSSWISNRNK